jgi:cell division protein FtsQ
VVLGGVRGALFRWGLGGGIALGLLVLLVAQAPRLLRRLSIFRVERVEVVGTRYLAPHLALAASGITEQSNLFDDPAPWRAALLAHPLVADVIIERDFPGTLLVQIVEVEPVALVATPVLRPVDAEGRFLPIEPAAEDVDFPVIAVPSEAGEDGKLKDSAALALVEALDRLGRLAPGLVTRISAIAPLESGDLRLLLREPARGEALLPADFNALRVEQLRLALADLDAKRELPRVRRIDVRFRDQVVVSLTSG